LAYIIFIKINLVFPLLKDKTCYVLFDIELCTSWQGQKLYVAYFLDNYEM